MDEALELLMKGHVAQGMAHLFTALEATRQRLSADEWRGDIERRIRPHPVTRFVHRDPCTYRGFSKPRGYPGDAVLLDYIYGDARSIDDDPVAARIQAFTTSSVASQAVRHRRDRLARLIDESADAQPGCQIVSIACGHLREACGSCAVRSRRCRILALDQDALSLRVVARNHDRTVVATEPWSVNDIVAGRVRIPPCHLVYAAGLLDYLSARVARRLVARMFDAIVPGGRLLLANFLPGVPDRAYMEAMMSWWLIYRTERDLEAVVDVPQSQIQQLSLDRDPFDAVVYCSVQKAG